MLKEYQSFLSLSAAAVLKYISCLCCVQTTRTTPLFMGIHYMDGCWTCGWLLTLKFNVTILIYWWFVLHHSFLYCVVQYMQCVFLDLYFSSIFGILIFPDLFCCVWMAYTLVMFMILYWNACQMCGLYVYCSAALYFCDVPLWFCSFLLFPFLPHPLLSPSSPSSCSLRLWNREKLNTGKRRRRLLSRNCTR